ncbi:hypothetical protein SprV_0902775500 [Sparganum proliferum]
MLRPRPLRISEPDLEQAKDLGRNSSEQGFFANCCGRDRRKTTEESTGQVGQPFPHALSLVSRSYSGLYDNIPPFSVRKGGLSDVLEGVRESVRTLVEQVYEDRAELTSLIQQKFAPYGRLGDAQRRLEADVPEGLPLEDLPSPYAQGISASKVGVTPAESGKGIHVEERIMKALGRGTLSPETVQKVKQSLRSLIEDVQRGNVEVTSLLQRVLATNSDVAVQHESASKAPGRKSVEEVGELLPAVFFPGQDKGLPFSSGLTGTRDRESPRLETPFVPSLAVSRTSGVIIEDTPQRTDEGIGAGGSRSEYAADSVEERGVRYQENGTKIPSGEPNDKSSRGRCDISRLGRDIQTLMNEIRSGYQRIRVVVEEACLTDCQRLSPQIQTQTNGETATDSQNTNDFSKGEEAKSAKSLSEGKDRSYIGEETPGLTSQTPDKNSQAEIPQQESKWEDHSDTEVHEQQCETTWELKLTPLPPRTEVDARECLTTSDVEKPSANVTSMEDASSKATVVRMSATLSVPTDRRSVGSSTEAAYEQSPSADQVQSSEGSRGVSSKQVATMTELGEERASPKPSKISLMITTCSTKWQDTKQGILASLRGRGCSFLPATSTVTSSAPTDTPDGSKDNSKELENYEPFTAGSPVPPPSKMSAARFRRGCNCLSHEASTRISTESEESVISRQETRENIFNSVPMLPVSTDSEKGRESLGSMPGGVLDQNSISMVRNPARKSSIAGGRGQALGMKAPETASLESEGRDSRLNQSSLEDSPAVQMLLGDFNPSEALTTGTTVPSSRTSVEESTENAPTASELRPEQPDNEAELQDTHQEGSEMPEEPGPPDDQVGQIRRSSSPFRASKETRAMLTSPIPSMMEAETPDLSPALDFDSDLVPSLSPDPVTSLGRTSRSSTSQSSPTELLAARKSLEGRRVPSPSFLAPPGRNSIVLREADATGKRFSIELTSQRSSGTSEGRSESRLQRLEPQPDGGGRVDELTGEKKADSLKAEAVLRHSLRSDRASQTGDLVGRVSSPSDGINSTTITVSRPGHSITNGLPGSGPLPNSELPTTTVTTAEEDDDGDAEREEEEEEEERKEAERVRGNDGSRSRPKVPRKKYSPLGSSKQLLPPPSRPSGQPSACPGHFHQSEQAHTKIPRCRKASTALPPACSEPQSLATPPVEKPTARRLPRCPHRAPFRARGTQDSQACEMVEDEGQDDCAPPSQRPRHPRKA